jgi:hypothetical protein
MSPLLDDLLLDFPADILCLNCDDDLHMNERQFALAIKGKRYGKETIAILRDYFLNKKLSRQQLLEKHNITTQRLTKAISSALANYEKQLASRGLQSIQIVVHESKAKALDLLEESEFLIHVDKPKR